MTLRKMFLPTSYHGNSKKSYKSIHKRILGGYEPAKSEVDRYFYVSCKQYNFCLFGVPHLLLASGIMNFQCTLSRVHFKQQPQSKKSNIQSFDFCISFCIFQGMGGQFDFFGLWIDQEFGVGHSKAKPLCTTYKSPQLSKSENFKIEALNVWGVGEEPKKLDEDEENEVR